MTDYIKINWPDVQAGNVLMHANGDRLTVSAVEYAIDLPPTVSSLNVRLYTEAWESAGFSPYRKAPEIPTAPGAYLDKAGNPWLLDETGDWNSWNGYFYTPSSDAVRDSAPFTRLVPMPTREALGEAIGGEVATAAVMSLLSGEANSTEVDRG